MNPYNQEYVARLAPCAGSWQEAISHGQEVVHNGEVVRESFAPDAFRSTVVRSVPVLLSHDEEKGPVGYLSALLEQRGWIIGAFSLDHSRFRSALALDLLRVGAPVSIGFSSLEREAIAAQDGISWHLAAHLNEVSILRRGDVGWFQGAVVTAIYERSPSPAPASRTASDRGETLLAPQLIVRRNVGQVLGVR